MEKRSIYRRPEGENIVDKAIRQYKIVEDAFYDHLEKTRKLQILIDSLTDDEYEKYMDGTQP